MLDRALLALADERGSGQDHGEHGEIVDDLHHRGEPARLQVRVELCARDYFDRQAHQSFAPGDELCDVVGLSRRQSAIPRSLLTGPYQRKPLCAWREDTVTTPRVSCISKARVDEFPSIGTLLRKAGTAGRRSV